MLFVEGWKKRNSFLVCCRNLNFSIIFHHLFAVRWWWWWEMKCFGIISTSVFGFFIRTSTLKLLTENNLFWYFFCLRQHVLSAKRKKLLFYLWGELYSIAYLISIILPFLNMKIGHWETWNPKKKLLTFSFNNEFYQISSDMRAQAWIS